MTAGALTFFGLVFLAVFLLFWALVVPAFGDDARTRRLLRRRLSEIDSGMQAEVASLLRAKYLRELSPLERRLEELPWMASLAKLIEQAGRSMLAYRLVLFAAACAVFAAMTGWVLTRMPVVALAAAFAGGIAPFLKVMSDRKTRFDKLEEQMPDAIDVMKRALRAGHPFASTLKLVADDMDQPIAREFEQTFADINYGNDLRRALLGLLSRVPSVSMMALTTGVLVQKETGGNLAEILDQISKVIRARFRFYRKVRTLSAEGRLSAWILTLVPVVLFAVIWITSPNYLPVMLKNPMGQNLMVFAGVMMVLGVLWIRRIIRLQV